MEKGVSLLESVVALGAFGLTTIVMATGFSYIFKQQQRINQKVESSQLEHIISASLINPQNCSCMLNPINNITNGFPLTFDETGIDPGDPSTFASMRLSTIYGGCDASDRPDVPLVTAGQVIPGSVPEIKIEKILFDNIQPVSIPNNQYQGTFSVHFASGNQSTPMKPIQIKQMFIAAGSPGALQVEECRAVSFLSKVAIKQLCEETYNFKYDESTDPNCIVDYLTQDQGEAACATIGGRLVLDRKKCRVWMRVPPTIPFIGGTGADCDIPIRGGAPVTMNINETLENIAELLTTPEFSGEFQLQARLAEVFSFESSREVIAGIYQLVGVDAKDSSEIFSFLSGKETLKEDQIVKVMKESQLNRRQSEILIAKVAQSMAGDLQ